MNLSFDRGLRKCWLLIRKNVYSKFRDITSSLRIISKYIQIIFFKFFIILKVTKTKINILSVAALLNFFSFFKRYPFDGFGCKILAPDFLNLLPGILKMTAVN